MTRRHEVASRDRRGGFTLAEMVVAILILGILAGIGIPNFQKAMWKAGAAHMVSDAHTVHLAAAAFLQDNGRFPSGSGWGSVPSELEPYLPDGFEFEYGEVDYLWIGIRYPSDDNWWGTRNLGLFAINYSQQRQYAEPMRQHQGTNAYWGGTLFFFIYLD